MNKSSTFHSWLNDYFYNPGMFAGLISMLLSPFSSLYSLCVQIKKGLARPVKFSVPIISVGNLVLGGSGKTPLTRAIFELFSPRYRTYIILRGYKRKSRGMVVVCENGKILCDTQTSGDEAMEYACFMSGANVIVSQKREIAINEAIKRGAQLILLDDGFGKFNIKKFNIILRPHPEPKANLTIPSGAYRYPQSFYSLADFIPRKADIINRSEILNASARMLLVSGIANPQRLSPVFHRCIAHVFFPDHYEFKKEELEELFKKHEATSLLVTGKDFVKIKDFGLPLSLLSLKTSLSDNFKYKLENYVKSFDASK